MKHIFLYLSIISIGLFSCSKDFLETYPTQDIDESMMFRSTTDALMAINGIHRLMYEASGTTGTTTSWYGQGGYQTVLLNLAMMGEDLVYTRNNPVFQTSARWVMHRNTADKDLDYNYRFFYRVIGNANKIIENIDGAEGPSSEKENIKGQALVYRALSHFFLVQFFGERYKAGESNTQLGIIIKTNNSLDLLPRSSVEEAYTLINQDLDEAITLLAGANVTRANKSHISVHVARGIKARVALAQGKWQDAANYADQVITGSGAALQADTYITTQQRMSNILNPEWLWGKSAVQDQGGTLREWHAFISNRNVSYNRNTPRVIYNKLYDQISATDVRKNVWFPNAQDPTVLPRPIIPPAGNIRNYMSNKWLLTVDTDNCADVAYMRLPEMILIKAEALARQGNSTDAAAALFVLAKHRDAAYVLSTQTGVNLIEEIMVQRRVELWAEGFRWLDLKRLNLPLDRGPKPRDGYNQGGWSNSNVMPTNVDPDASNYNMYDEQGMGEENRYKAVGHVEWQWLFPNAEVTANPLLVQNPLQ